MTKEMWTLAVAIATIAPATLAISGAWLHERYAGRSGRRDQATRLLRQEAEAAAAARADQLGWEGEALLWRARQAREDAAPMPLARLVEVIGGRDRSAKVLAPPAGWWPTAPDSRPRPVGVTPLQAVVADLRSRVAS